MVQQGTVKHSKQYIGVFDGAGILQVEPCLLPQCILSNMEPFHHVDEWRKVGGLAGGGWAGGAGGGGWGCGGWGGGLGLGRRLGLGLGLAAAGALRPWSWSRAARAPPPAAHTNPHPHLPPPHTSSTHARPQAPWEPRAYEVLTQFAVRTADPEEAECLRWKISTRRRDAATEDFHHTHMAQLGEAGW